MSIEYVTSKGVWNYWQTNGTPFLNYYATAATGRLIHRRCEVNS
jgi:hypothetical protein